MTDRAWIFVSHSSADLLAVRRVRNHLEELGAGPLLFHLLSLKHPEEFWPLIEREIAERNFFLYCDSPAAAASSWVQREREAVARKPIPGRVGTIRVDEEPLDLSALDDFIAMTRVFPSFSFRDQARVEPYLAALRAAGFSVFDARKDVMPGHNWRQLLERELARTAAEGWVVVFLSAASIASAFVGEEVALASRLGSAFVPVLIDPLSPAQLGTLSPFLNQLQAFDAFSHADGPTALANALLRRPR